MSFAPQSARPAEVAATTVSVLLDRARRLEDGRELRDTLDELARRVTRVSQLWSSHLLGLHDYSSWGASSPRATLHRLAQTVAWTLLEEDRTAPEDFLKTARRRLDSLLDSSSRRIHNNPRRMVSLDALGDALSRAPTPDLVLEAEELRDAMLARTDLSPAERRVLAARMELGPGATGEEVADAAGVPVGSERVRTHRLREKLQ